MADLLGSILGSMEKPPTLDEHQQQHAKKQQQQQNKLEQLQEKERIRLESFKKTIQQTVQKFVNSSDEKLKLKPMEVNCRAIIHEISDAAGLTSFSFGDEDVDRHVVLWKKEFAPCDQEITALRNGDEWDPEKAKLQAKLKLEQLEAEQNHRLADKVIPKCNYQEKYQHLIGTMAAKDAAQTTNANRSYGFVPSENKRDQRTIEQVMADNKARKKIKTTHEPDSEDT